MFTYVYRMGIYMYNILHIYYITYVYFPSNFLTRWAFFFFVFVFFVCLFFFKSSKRLSDKRLITVLQIGSQGIRSYTLGTVQLCSAVLIEVEIWCLELEQT